LKNCPECDNYQRGHGNQKCLDCKKYIQILKSSVKRKQIHIEVITDNILNSLPDNRQTTVYDAIRQIPLEFSVPLMLYTVLDCNQREIAQTLKMSQQQASKKIKIAIEIIKKIPVFEQNEA
jgi:DNA-directed RNA polymerase specialized sigma24 family protein